MNGTMTGVNGPVHSDFGSVSNTMQDLVTLLTSTAYGLS